MIWFIPWSLRWAFFLSLRSTWCAAAAARLRRGFFVVFVARCVACLSRCFSLYKELRKFSSPSDGLHAMQLPFLIAGFHKGRSRRGIRMPAWLYPRTLASLARTFVAE
ncbi:hypothetical protein IF1G_06295 [Cordyceps javanica]|uniref:Uncharacterized protein n=1 Tax=Cordyceps javanica TaxID=43265 RepID=A0A545V0Q9_9HYPO|nr:hypothetical protein IF1G_06295 [Cordyceps javanica]